MHEQRIAVVTGGERGIGRSIVHRLAADGWLAIAAGIDEVAGEGVGVGCVAQKDCRFMRCDVSDEESVRALFRKIADRYKRLDGLVLNAGLAAPERLPIEQVGLDDWSKVIAVNLTGAFLCAKHAAPALRMRGGSVVVVASTRATMSEPNTFAYSASKGGLLALTHCLAVSLGPETRVNAISPGWIHTGDPSDLTDSDHRQHPVGRVGVPADIASMAAYLLGPDSGFVTGQDFVVDGGMTRKMIYTE